MYKNKARIKSGPFIHKAGGVFFIFFFFFSSTYPLGEGPGARLEPFQQRRGTVASGRCDDDPPHCPLHPREECGKISPTNGDDGAYLSAVQTKKNIYVHLKTKKPCMNPHHTYRFFFFSVYRVGSTKLSCPIRVSCCLHAVTGDQVNYSQPLCFNLKGCFILTTDRSICLYWCCHFCRQEWARELDRRYVGNHVSSVSKVYK